MQDTQDIMNPRDEPAVDAAGSQPQSGTPEQAELEERLRKAELAAQEHHEAWLRSRADAENMRKRSQTEIANAHKFAVESFAGDLLPVKDSLEAAIGTATATVDTMRSGVELTLRQLKSVFEKFNLVEIDPAGEKFDPHRHQAISMVESDAEPNSVVQVLQKGYLLHDRVVRPALVTVAKAKGIEN